MANLGTFLTMLLVFIQLVWSKNLKKFSFLLLVDTLIFSLLINSGCFLKTGNLVLDYEEFLLILYILVTIINGGLNKIRSSLLKGSFILLFIAIVGIFLLIVNPNKMTVMPVGGSWDAYYSGRIELIPLEFSIKNVERFIRLFFFIIAIVGISNLIKEKKITQGIIKAIIYITVIQVALGYLDLVTKLIYNQPVLQSIADSFFGGVLRLEFIPVRANAVFIQGLMQEPSHYAVSFIPGLTILALSSKKKIKFTLLKVSAILILFLSGSFLGAGIITYWLMLTIYKSIFKSKYMKGISISLVFGLTLIIVSIVGLLTEVIPLLNYYTSRLFGLVGFGPITGSEGVRLLSIAKALESFAKNPFFGIGIGSTSVHGFIPSLISNIGIFGFIAWLLFFTNAFNIRKRSIFPLVLWIMLAIFSGDIGWLFNGMGIAMLIGISHESITSGT